MGRNNIIASKQKRSSDPDAEYEVFNLRASNSTTPLLIDAQNCMFCGFFFVFGLLIAYIVLAM